MAVRKVSPIPEVSLAELEAAVCALVEERAGLTGAELRKAIEKRWRGAGERALVAADELAAQQRLHRFSTARKVRYFHEDPQVTLPHTILDALAQGPMSEPELKRTVEERAPGLGDLVKEWVKGALARGDLHLHGPAPGAKGKRIGREPDVRALLKAPLAALGKALATKAARLVPRQQVLAVLAAELGVPWPPEVALAEGVPPAAAAEDEREVVLRALGELSELPGATALLSIRELRPRVALDKAPFDRVVLALAKEGVVSLHHHDFPMSLAPAERADLVVDERGTHYVGIARRRGR